MKISIHLEKYAFYQKSLIYLKLSYFQKNFVTMPDTAFQHRACNGSFVSKLSSRCWKQRSSGTERRTRSGSGSSSPLLCGFFFVLLRLVVLAIPLLVWHSIVQMNQFSSVKILNMIMTHVLTYFIFRMRGNLF